MDVLKDGSLSIIDYKTGAGPSKSQVEQLLAPQLPLEAAMAKRGAFGDTLTAEANELAYVRLRPSGEFKPDIVGGGPGKKDRPADQLAEEAWAELRGLIAAYRKPERGYASKLHPPMDDRWGSDYDHLARLREWSAAEDGEAEGEPE